MLLKKWLYSCILFGPKISCFTIMGRQSWKLWSKGVLGQTKIHVSNHFLSSTDLTYQNFKIIICLVSGDSPYFCTGLLEQENMVFREGRWQLCVFTKKFSSKSFDVYGSKTIENPSTQYCHWLFITNSSNYTIWCET
jgi:hypothetical protein